MPSVYTESDFDRLSWHDCRLWRMEVRAGDPEESDWTSDLVLDVDFIVEWVCAVDVPARFRVAPADLVFHGVTALKVHIDWDGGDQASLHPLSIDRIERRRVTDQKVYLDRPYYAWTVALNWPQGARIGFGAVGFTQTLRAEPVLTDSQALSRR